MSAESVAASYRDPSGFVYRREGVLYRQINHSFRDSFDHFIKSGLYDELVADELLVPHSDADRSLAATDDAYHVIQPRVVPFISYPYEWAFSQLKDAALLTLDIQRRALKRGLVLRDATAYNVQMADGRPVFIDTLSFGRYTEGEPWVGYRQFCQHFLAPLALMAFVDPSLVELSRTHIDGIPLALASKLLPVTSRLRPGVLMHLRWALSFVLVLLCGLGIAGLTGARRLDSVQARRGALLASLVGPLVLLAGFLYVAY